MNRQNARFHLVIVSMVLAAIIAPSGVFGESAAHGQPVAHEAVAGALPQHEAAAPAAHSPSTTGHSPSTAGHGAEAAPALTADQVIGLLKEGNTHFLADKLQHPNSDGLRRADTAAKGQKPMVTIISCSDSRVPLELIFDRGIGELFVIRVAGNVCNTDELGSAEYGVDHLGTPILLVMGHTRCGAVTAVAGGAALHGHIAPLVEHIKPAVESARKAHPELNGEAIVPFAIRANVLQGIEDILIGSPIIAEQVKSGKVRVEGAIYDIAEGRVEWLGPHPKQKELLEYAKSQVPPTGHSAIPTAKAAGTPASAGPAHAEHANVSAAAVADASASNAALTKCAVQSQPATGEQVAGWIPAKPPQSRQSTGTPPGLLQRCMAEELYRQGARHLQAGEYVQAASRFREAAEIDSSMLAARSDLAGVYCLQQKYKEALSIYASILAVDGQYHNALRGSALCYASLKQYDQSKAMLQKLVDLDARDARSWLELGDVNFLGGDPDAAGKCWRTAAEIDPTASDITTQVSARLRTYAPTSSSAAGAQK